MGIWIFAGAIGLLLTITGAITYLIGLHRDSRRIINTGIGTLIAGFCAVSVGICFALNYLVTDEQMIFRVLQFISALMGGHPCSP